MTAVVNFATLADVKAWLGIANVSGGDAELTRLINSASTFLRAYLSRDIPLQSYTERRNGAGVYSMPTLQFPIFSVSEVMIDNSTITAAQDANSAGYVFDESTIYLRGSTFRRGVQNIEFKYAAGYGIAGEAATVASSLVTPLAPLGPWATDMGVSYANGTALTAVASAPAAGQYVAPTPWAASPVLTYGFNAADNGQAVLLTYGYIPSAIEQVCIELVGERFKTKQRIGISSQSVQPGGGGENIAYSQKDLNDAAKMMLQPFRQVFPIT